MIRIGDLMIHVTFGKFYSNHAHERNMFFECNSVNQKPSNTIYLEAILFGLYLVVLLAMWL